VHALHNIHAALAPGGMLIDTQPISAHPPVTANGVELGRLDMREWLETIRAVDNEVGVTLTAGLYAPGHHREFTVTSTFDDGPDCLEIAGSWQGTTRVPPLLATQLAATHEQVALEQQIRLRLLRRTPGRT
jgi:hypothetical protein